MVPEYYTQMGPRPLSLFFLLQVFYLFRLIFETFLLRTVCFWSGFKLSTVSQMTLKLSVTREPCQFLSECSCQGPSMGIAPKAMARIWTLSDLGNSSGVAFPSASNLLLIWLSLVPNPLDSLFQLSLLILSLHSFSNQQILVEHLLWARHHINC